MCGTLSARHAWLPAFAVFLKTTATGRSTDAEAHWPFHSP